MDYFVITSKSDAKGAVIERLPDDGPADWRYHEGEPLAKAFPKGAVLGFSRNHPDRRELRDFLANPLGLFIVSAKARAVVEGLGGVAAEFLRVAIRDHAGALVAEDYAILNLLGTVPAIDLKRSQYTMGSLDKTQINGIDQLIVDRDAIGPKPVFFRASTMRRLAIIREDAKAAFERAALTGWKGYPCDGWNGFYL